MVLDVFSRAIVGWSIADHMRAELVVDALQMATWRRQPPAGTVVHSDRGAQTPPGLRAPAARSGAARLPGPGRILVDNTMIESFWSTMQRELLDTRTWDSPDQLASAIFEWIEAWYNPRRRHTILSDLAPADYETLHTAAVTAA